MSADPRLVIFDVDGTLVDSQADIIAAMTVAFEAVEQPVPSRRDILGIVGLSLEVAMATLAPSHTAATHKTMAAAYRAAYFELREQGGVKASSPLYPGAHAALQRLNELPNVLLGIATGKSRRGLDRLIEGHALDGVFVTQQVADFHPSKPHPSMILQAMSDVGADPHQTVMIGDTEFDMDMAKAAGVHAIGVTWGYHQPSRLGQADVIIDGFAALPPALDQIWGILHE